jgi:MFS family permease
MLFVLLSAAGAVYVVLIVFVQQAFHSITRHLGVLAVTLGAGLFLGAIGYGRFGKKIAWQKIIFSCLAAGGIMMVLFVWGISLWPNVWLAFVLTLGLGLVVGPIFIASNTVVHMVADEQMQGKVFSSLEIVIHLAFLISMLISSWLSDFVTPAIILTFVGGVFFFIGLGGFIRFRKEPGVINGG